MTYDLTFIILQKVWKPGNSMCWPGYGIKGPWFQERYLLDGCSALSLLYDVKPLWLKIKHKK